jgi:hypothetical protein
LLKQDYIRADETTMIVVGDDNVKSYMWVYNQWHSLKKQCHSLKELAVFYQVALTTSRLFSLLAVCHFPYGFFERRS